MVAKRTIGIFSHYDASEKTLCALYLASHIIRRYRYVVWVVPDDVTPQSKYYGFSHQWDVEVLSLASKKEEITERLAACELCFFFNENADLYSLLPATTRTAVFLDPYEWNHDTSRQFAKQCTYAISVSPYITKKIVYPNLLMNEILCPFDPAVQIAPQPRFVSGETASLFYNTYGMSFMERQFVQQVADIVKACCPESKSVLCCYNAKETPEPGKDTRAYDWKLLSYLKQADWLVDLTPKPLLGFFPAFAGTLGIQWFGFDLPPNTDEYSAARRHLIPYPSGGLISENAETIARRIVQRLTTPFSDEIDRNRGSGAYVSRLTKFTRSINQMLGIKGSRRER